MTANVPPDAPIATGPRRVRDDLLRYAICGACASAVDYAVFWLLTARAGWGSVFALLLSRPVGGLIGFVGNRCWTWRRQRTFTLNRQFGRFWMVWIVSYALAAAVMYVLSRRWPNDFTLAWVVTGLSVGLFGFLLQRAFTFR